MRKNDANDPLIQTVEESMSYGRIKYSTRNRSELSEYKAYRYKNLE